MGGAKDEQQRTEDGTLRITTDEGVRVRGVPSGINDAQLDTQRTNNVFAIRLSAAATASGKVYNCKLVDFIIIYSVCSRFDLVLYIQAPTVLFIGPIRLL